MRDNALTCTVGFLPRHVAVRYGFQPPIWFAKNTEIFELSDNTQKRKSAYENKGVAKYERINVPEIVNVNIHAHIRGGIYN